MYILCSQDGYEPRTEIFYVDFIMNFKELPWSYKLISFQNIPSAEYYKWEEMDIADAWAILYPWLVDKIEEKYKKDYTVDNILQAWKRVSLSQIEKDLVGSRPSALRSAES